MVQTGSEVVAAAVLAHTKIHPSTPVCHTLEKKLPGPQLATVKCTRGPGNVASVTVMLGLITHDDNCQCEGLSPLPSLFFRPQVLRLAARLPS